MTEEKKTGRGGKREGAGRPKGTLRSNKSEIFYRKVTADEKEYLEKCLDEYRQKNNG